MRRLAFLLTPVVLTVATAQDPPSPPDLDGLARRVETAHRPDGPVPPVTALRAVLELRLEDRNAEDRGQVDLALAFLQWQRAAGKKPLPLLHYRVLDAGTAIVRGMDTNGPWQLDREEPKSLTGADAAQDLTAFERHQNLVKQLLRCLSPGDVLRSLQQPGPIGEESLALTATKKVPCLTVAGRLDAFPLLQSGGDDAAVALKVWVGKADGRLLAVDATPLRGDVREDAKGERIVLAGYEVRDGLLVPFRLFLYQQPGGSLTLQSTVSLKDLSLRPELRAEDFDRVRVARDAVAQQRRRK